MLLSMLSSLGVSQSTVDLLVAYDIGGEALRDLAPDDLVGLTGCPEEEASLVLDAARGHLAASASATYSTGAPAVAAPSVAVAPSAPPPTATDGRAAPIAAYQPQDDDDDDDEGGAEVVADPELRLLLSTLGISKTIVRRLEQYGIGLEATRLLSAQDLTELTGCSIYEAETIVAGSNTPTTLGDATASAAQSGLAPLPPSGTELTVAEGEKQELSEEEASAVFGYPVDDFQQRTLKVIVQPGLDLIAMAPTGSGKTAVALMAILQAFRRGQKAIYTSPIKALSNQKYAEFKSWFKNRGLAAGVTLLTGDIKIRAPPGTPHELISCTSEILRNKVVKLAGTDTDAEAAKAEMRAAVTAAAAVGGSAAAATAAAAAGDADLHNLGCVVSDEIHYINDVERGVVCGEPIVGHSPPTPSPPPPPPPPFSLPPPPPSSPLTLA